MILRVVVNGGHREADVEPRLLLSDFLRQELGLTGTDGHAVDTVESLSPDGVTLNPLQQAFRDAHGLQCGFCTPGILMTLSAFLRDNRAPSEQQVRDALSANLCRCTGYQHIVEAVTRASGTALR